MLFPIMLSICANKFDGWVLNIDGCDGLFVDGCCWVLVVVELFVFVDKFDGKPRLKNKAVI